jgi:antitoxin (DNA-binding transcriptional repressor) of toxin-antitoxin stability system
MDRVQRERISMTRISIEQAQAKLTDLIHDLGPGDELMIIENDQPVARLVRESAGPRSDLRRSGAQQDGVNSSDFEGPLDNVEGPEMATLRDAAKRHNEKAFVAAMRSMDWSNRPAEDFLIAAKLALEAGAFDAARHLSTLGVKAHPGDSRLLKYADALAPPKIIRRQLSQDSSIKANRDWLKTHGEEHRGRWIALRDGVLVGEATSFSDLVKEVGKGKDILITKVY